MPSVTSVDEGMMHVEEVSEDGSIEDRRMTCLRLAMLMPAFRGVKAVKGIEGLSTRAASSSPTSTSAIRPIPNIFALGVCVAIPPTGATPVPVGVPKTGFMIESMVTAIAQNLKAT